MQEKTEGFQAVNRSRDADSLRTAFCTSQMPVVRPRSMIPRYRVICWTASVPASNECWRRCENSSVNTTTVIVASHEGTRCSPGVARLYYVRATLAFVKERLERRVANERAPCAS